MTTQDFNNIPLFSNVGVQWGDDLYHGYLIRKTDFIAIVYLPSLFVVAVDIYPSMLTLEATYLPFQVPPPPYSFFDIPLFSTVRDKVTGKLGILIDKYGDPPQGDIFFGDNSVLWRNSTDIEFSELPPGNYYNPVTFPDTAPGTVPSTIPDTVIATKPDTTTNTIPDSIQSRLDQTSGSVLLIFGAVVLIALAWH